MYISTDLITSLKSSSKLKKYVRYMDDFSLFSDDREFLAEARFAIENLFGRSEVEDSSGEKSAL